MNGKYVSEMIAPGEALWTTHPSTNGVGQLMMHPLDAQASLARGYIVMNGQRARVTQTCPEWPTVLTVQFDDAVAAAEFNPRPTDATAWTAAPKRRAA